MDVENFHIAALIKEKLTLQYVPEGGLMFYMKKEYLETLCTLEPVITEKC
jgi:hypothetical protein